MATAVEGEKKKSQKSKDSSVFTKHLPNIKLATRLDADGKEIQVERREDEEQNLKQQEIFDILVAAGYFRARIKGLSAFDKIVGGMTWCIECCEYGVDVDLLFHENLTIGQKISLTEKIVTVLPQMKCPYLLEPHQIQGLDFISIHPVIQWLVKKSVENRAERAENLKKYAETQFNAHFQFRSDKELSEKAIKDQEEINEKRKSEFPKRVYRRKDYGNEDEFTKVRITLLEYGNEGKIVGKDSGSSKDDIEEDPLDNDVNVEQLLKAMNETTEEIDDTLLNLNEEDRSTLKKHYDDFKQEMEIDAKELSAQNQLKNLQTTKQALEKKLLKIKDENKECELEMQSLKAALEEDKIKKANLEKEIQDFEKIEKDSDKKVLDEIQNLVKQNEDLKQEEAKFKEQCREEMARIQQEITDAENQAPPSDLQECEDLLEKEQANLAQLRLRIAKKNRQIVVIQRQLDNIPDRAELAQYQRRFIELYNQVSAKHRETKQFYTLYNTLDDTKRYMEKELNLLNSIYETYQEGMHNPHSRDQFLKQFEAIVDGVKQTQTKVRLKCNEEKAKRDALNTKLMGLLELQRKYAAAIKQLTKECQRCEALSLHLKSIQ